MKELIQNKKVAIILVAIIGGIMMIILNYIGQSNNQNSFSFESIEENQIEENKIENIQINQTEEKQEEIAVHITGEVKKQGIVYLKIGARITDAIKAAGGTTKKADIDKVNLAYVLADGQKIYIPNKNEKIQITEYITENSGQNVLVEEANQEKGKGENRKVNINEANQSELENLPGIGSSIAKRIIEYREENGKFQKKEDIQKVKGIGDAKYSNIKDHISI